MSSRLSFHPKDHQFAYAPNFTQVALSNDQPIGDALTIIFKARKRAVPEDRKQQMTSIVENFAGDLRVGALRQLSDDQWGDLKLPLMARLYLKHLMKQSVSLTHLELLECDFNQGNPINWNDYDDLLIQCINMGFQKNQALEALVVCRKNIQDALEFLLMTDMQRKKERDQARRTINMFVPPSQHHTVLQAEKEARKELEKYNNFTGRELKEEIDRIKSEVETARNRNKVIEQEIEDKRRAHQKNLYREYMRGLLCNSSIGAEELQRQQKYMKQRGIDDEAHKAVLQELGFTLENFEEMKDLNTTTFSNECVICLDPPRDHMVLPCKHCCLCADCAQDFEEGDILECPQCRGEILEIKKVIFSP